ncbi:ABC transporter substrate-binding protein [Methylobacterium brachiatum]
MRRSWIPRLIAAAGALLAPAPASSETTVRAVLEAEIVTLDPYFTTAYITRTFGFMVYDTLFAPDAKGQFKPQMVDTWSVSDDRLTWRFTLRDGLRFHDGTPVRAADCVASLKRWAARSALGGRLMDVAAALDAVDDRTFVLTLREPYGLVLDTLGTTSSPTPFIMPVRLAATPPTTQLTEVMGSGPFVYDRTVHITGDHMLLRKNPNYRPRSEPADFLAGGKVVKVDALDIRVIPDGATAVGALGAGEIDLMQYAPFDLIEQIEHNKNLAVMNFTGPHRFTGHYRINTAAKPFDDPAIRRVLLRLVDQREVLDGFGLDPRFSQTCDAFFICGSPYETHVGAELLHDPSVAAARAALKATAYKGEPVIVMAANDLEAARVSSTILADRLKQAGFTVDLQVMDWAALLARRTKKTGWSVFGIHALGLDLSSPLTNSAINFTCKDAASSGFMCDTRMVRLFDRFAREPDPDKRRDIAGEIQSIVYGEGLVVPFGQFAQPAAYRTSLTGLIPSAIPLFWNVEKP